MFEGGWFMINSWLNTSKKFKAQMVGKLLGDAGITIQVERKPRLKFNHRAADYQWSHYCYEQLSETLPLNKPVQYKQIDHRLKKGFSMIYYVQSLTHPIISYLYSKWYPKGKKTLPITMIESHFTPESLAWWYMDDGHLKWSNNTLRKIVLSTECFSVQEIEWLIHFLQQTYKLPFTMDGQHRIVIYDQFHIHYFLKLIEPYSLVSMHRKLKPLSHLPSRFVKQRRTTLYLSKSIKLINPTTDINNALKELDTLIRLFKEGEIYNFFIERKKNKTLKRSYQIVINSDNLEKLNFLKLNTGVTYSDLAEACFRLTSVSL